MEALPPVGVRLCPSRLDVVFRVGPRGVGTWWEGGQLLANARAIGVEFAGA